MKCRPCSSPLLPSADAARSFCRQRSLLLMLFALLLTAAISVQVAAQTTETFSTAAPAGWMLSPGAQSKNGVLSCSGMGHGFWIAAFPADFRMTLRYRHGTGIGHIAFRGTGELPKDTDYRLRLDGATAVLARALQGQEGVIAAQPLALTSGSWHDVVIEMTAGQIGLTVDGKAILGVTDPQPLPNGIMGFGTINGQGFAFDDIAVSPAAAGTAAPSGTGPTVTPTSGLTEAFNTAAPAGWILLPGAVVEAGALTCSGLGHGVWIASFPADFTLSLRYRQGPGLGQIIFRYTGELPKDTDYRLQLHELGVQIIRVAGGQESTLIQQRSPITQGGWHDVVLQVIGGQITLTIDAKKVLSVTDPQPLPNGIMGFGAVNTTGIAFDDIAVSPAAGP